MALFILLNNFLHDLAAAIWICGTILLWLLSQEIDKEPDSQKYDRFFGRIARKFSVITLASLAVIVIGGIIRALAYREYEWVPAAGRGQVTALVIKHVFFVLIVLVGIMLELRIWRRTKRSLNISKIISIEPDQKIH